MTGGNNNPQPKGTTMQAFTYFYGDKATYTGKTEMLYGKLAYEIKMVEGHRKGVILWTYNAPKN